MTNSTEPGNGEKPSRRRRILFSVVTVFLALLIIEVGLHVVRYVMNLAGNDVVDSKIHLSPYRDQPWAEQYFTEMHERETRYEPYYGWALEEYHGEYVNIDSQGLRKTYNPDFGTGPSPETLFVFGGSTIWGGGSRDDHSIPSWLSRHLNEKGYRLYVVNYGTTGYVFTQEVVRLMKALWDGHRPDYAIFYNGTNDVYSAYQSGQAGTFQNLDRIRERYRLISPTEQFTMGIKHLIANDCMIFRTGKKLVDAVIGAEDTREAAAGYSDAELQTLAGEIRQSYRQAAELLAYLADKYEFRYVCFWQPVAFLEDSLNTEERGSDNRLNDKALAELCRDVNDSLPSDPQAHFFNISDALAGRTETIYIDFCHISEYGNEIVAGVIAEIFEREILKSEQAVNY